MSIVPTMRIEQFVSELPDSPTDVSDATTKSFDIAAFISLIHFGPETLFEVRIPKVGQRNLTHAGFFTDAAKAAEAIKRFDVIHKPAGIYISLNPVIPGKKIRKRAMTGETFEVDMKATNSIGYAGAGTQMGNEDAARRNWFFVDIDPDRPAGTSSTESQMENSIALADVIESELSKGVHTEELPHRKSWFVPPDSTPQPVSTDLLKDLARTRKDQRKESVRANENHVPSYGSELPANDPIIAETISEAREKLKKIPKRFADDRDSWLKIGMALHYSHTSLLPEWIGFSKQSNSYNEGECEKIWNKINKSGGITCDMLNHYLPNESATAKHAKELLAGAAEIDSDESKGKLLAELKAFNDSQRAPMPDDEIEKTFAKLQKVESNIRKRQENIDVGNGVVRRSVDDPSRLAESFIEKLNAEKEAVRYWSGQWYRYRDGVYTFVEADSMANAIFASVESDFVSAFHREDLAAKGRKTPSVRKVNQSIVNNVLLSLRSRSTTEGQLMHDWQGGRNVRMGHHVAMENGILDLSKAAKKTDSDVLSQWSPSWFSTMKLSFAYNQHAQCPNWITFIGNTFGGDREAMETVQMWFGYLLTPDNSHQKMLFIIGNMRSGKGTIASVMTSLYGLQSVSNPKLSDPLFVSKNGRWSLRV